jgi:hypothetical protein
MDEIDRRELALDMEKDDPAVFLPSQERIAIMCKQSKIKMRKKKDRVDDTPSIRMYSSFGWNIDRIYRL